MGGVRATDTTMTPAEIFLYKFNSLLDVIIF